MIGIVNTFVHAIMYFYYFLTAFKPELKHSIWWKKHITQLQIAQFLYLAIHFLRALLTKDCNYPQFFLWLTLVENAFFLVLFSDFYVKAYRNKSKFD